MGLELEYKQSIKLKQNASSRCDFLLPDVPTVFFVKSSFEDTKGIKNKSNRKDKLLTIRCYIILLLYALAWRGAFEDAFFGCSSLTCVYGSQSVYDLAVNARASSANDCTYPPTMSPTMSPPWLHCPHINIPERVVYDSMDYNPMTGDFSMIGVQVGFFNLVRKVVIYAIRREPSQPDVQLGFSRIKITPGTSKFPLKSQPVENAHEVNFVRVKIIGNRVGEGSKSTTGRKSHPYWECVERYV